MDPFEYTSPHGTLYVVVMPAIERRGEEVPVLCVTTRRDYRTPDDERVMFTHRGYKIREFYKFVDGPYPWMLETAEYGDSFTVNDNGTEVTGKSPMRAKLHALTTEARLAFVETHPGWARESLRLAVEKKHSRAAGEAFRLRQQLADLEKTMSEYEKTLTEWEA